MRGRSGINDTSDVAPCWRCGKRFLASATARPGCGAPNIWERDDLDLPASKESLLPGVIAGVVAAVLLIALAAILWTVAAQ